MNKIYHSILEAKINEKKLLAVLIDPDKSSIEETELLLDKVSQSPPDIFLVGGSLIRNNHFDTIVQLIKEKSLAPVILFPGNAAQISSYADAIFFMSLISGRNADFLIGQQVISAPIIKSTRLESISLGYMLIDGGVPTSVSYMSNTTPIPADKHDIAASTAMAGEMLGLKMLYLEAGSGAKYPVPLQMIEEVKKVTQIPLIVGGGLRSLQQVEDAYKAGADIVVVGTAIENDPSFASELKREVNTMKI